MQVSERNLRICFGASGRFLQATPPGLTGIFSKKTTRFVTKKIVWRSLETYFCLDGIWMLSKKLGKNGYMTEKSKVQRSCLFKRSHFFSGIHGQSQGCTFYVVHLFILREASFPNKKRTKLVGVISFQPESCVINLLPTCFTPNDFFLCKCAWHLWCRLNRRHFICRICWSTKNENPTWPKTDQAKTCQRLNCRLLFLLISPSTWNESVVLRHELSSFCWTFVRLSDAESNGYITMHPGNFNEWILKMMGREKVTLG